MDTFETLFRRGDATLERVITRHWATATLPPWQALSAGEFVGDLPARADHGRWIVDCPAGCRDALTVIDRDRRYVCVTCGAGPYTVSFPPNRVEIEAVLDVRPIENRNWVDGSSLDDLRAENQEHGLPVLA